MTSMAKEPLASAFHTSHVKAAASAPTSVTVELHDSHHAHHYDSPQQQYDAAKFGMWLFLATEMLFFGGLFCLYAVYRGNNPDIFTYGSQYLSTFWGGVNTVVLILSSMTMAFAVRAAQLGCTRALLGMLGLTLLGGCVFMGIKTVEYTDKFDHGLKWGGAFYDAPQEHTTAEHVSDAPAIAIAAPAAGDAGLGRTLWLNTCLACHGDRGQGMPGQAFDIRGSEFVTAQSDKELINFIKQGRMPFDAANRTGIQMPPKGGNPMLKDEDLLHIVAYIRTFEAPQQSESAPDAPEANATEPPAAEIVDMTMLKSSIPRPAIGPRGLASTAKIDRPTQPPLSPNHATDPARPANAHIFFNIYFLMTGLHGIHVLIGMGVIVWLMLMSWRGAYSAAYFTPVELTGLYWHLVDLIWIFLFPLFYLIH